jgi:hypothetical protein
VNGAISETNYDGDSLWSAVVRYRFGSHLGFHRFQGRRNQWILSDHCQRADDDYQSGTELPHSKGSADLCTVFICDSRKPPRLIIAFAPVEAKVEKFRLVLMRSKRVNMARASKPRHKRDGMTPWVATPKSVCQQQSQPRGKRSVNRRHSTAISTQTTEDSHGAQAPAPPA